VDPARSHSKRSVCNEPPLRCNNYATCYLGCKTTRTFSQSIHTFRHFLCLRQLPAQHFLPLAFTLEFVIFLIHSSSVGSPSFPPLTAPNQLWLDQDTEDGRSTLPSPVLLSSYFLPTANVQRPYQEKNLDYLHLVSEYIQ